jgi:cytochrome P450/NADPH-cytochrome P450 reductase
MGVADAGEGDMFVSFESWEDDILWPALTKQYGTTSYQESGQQGPSLKVEVTTPRTSALRADVQEAEVITAKVLTADGEPIKEHIEIKLPSDTTYRAGDYLAVLPINPRQTVARALRKFELPWDSHLIIEAGSQVPLPTNASLPSSNIFGAYVELAQPATKRVSVHRKRVFLLGSTDRYKNILALSEATENDEDKSALKALATDSFESEVSDKRVSVLDLLEKYPSVKLPLGSFLAMLPPMRVRQ